MKKILTALFIIVSCLTCCASVFAERAPLESVYGLPKDNVDYALDPNIDYLIVGYHQAIPKEHIRAAEARMVFQPNDVDRDMIGIENATFAAYMLLKSRLKADYGIEIGLYDAYRTPKDQQWLIDSVVATFRTGEVGFSEHHTGLLLDVVVSFTVFDQYAGEYRDYYYSEAAVRTFDDLPLEVTLEPFQVLDSLLADYGFIERFPEGKEGITGVPYTPGEIRFVGSPEVAHAIMDNELTLEEYVAGR